MRAWIGIDFLEFSLYFCKICDEEEEDLGLIDDYILDCLWCGVQFKIPIWLSGCGKEEEGFDRAERNEIKKYLHRYLQSNSSGLEKPLLCAGDNLI